MRGGGNKEEREYGKRKFKKVIEHGIRDFDNIFGTGSSELQQQINGSRLLVIAVALLLCRVDSSQSKAVILSLSMIV
jgi:hypothetical protein